VNFAPYHLKTTGTGFKQKIAVKVGYDFFLPNTRRFTKNTDPTISNYLNKAQRNKRYDIEVQTEINQSIYKTSSVKSFVI
jgi:hypothetical protein